MEPSEKLRRIAEIAYGKDPNDANKVGEIMDVLEAPPPVTETRGVKTSHNHHDDDWHHRLVEHREH